MPIPGIITRPPIVAAGGVAPNLLAVTRTSGVILGEFDFDFPATISAGDLLIGICAIDAPSTFYSTPSGFTTLRSQTSFCGFWCGWKSASGSESGAAWGAHGGGSEGYCGVCYQFEAGTWDTVAGPEVLNEYAATLSSYTFAAKTPTEVALHAYVYGYGVDLAAPSIGTDNTSEGATATDEGTVALVDACDIETTIGTSPTLTVTHASDGVNLILVGVPGV